MDINEIKQVPIVDFLALLRIKQRHRPARRPFALRGESLVLNEDFVVIGKRRTCCGASFTCDAGVDRHDAILLGIGRDGRVVVIARCDKEGQ